MAKKTRQWTAADDGAPRPECQAGDIRFQAGAAENNENPVSTRFGFAVAAGDLNGDGRVDLVVGDPENNRAYVFFGRASVTAGYGLDAATLFDRAVAAETQADVILVRDPSTSPVTICPVRFPSFRKR